MSREALGLITILFYACAFPLAFLALWRSRTPQGATAWILALLGFPHIAVPAFLFFGRKKFLGYVKERKELEKRALREITEAENIYGEQVPPPDSAPALGAIAAQLKQPAFTGGNQIELLVGAELAYERMLAEIEGAKKYILFQFYIFRNDQAGRRFAEALKRKAKAGVRVYFLYDKIGSSLSNAFVSELRSAGIEVAPFQSSKNWIFHFQINFRNHRKVLVVDGDIAFLGGLNIGDDYLGRWKSVGPWRDAQLCVKGPAALAAQLSFLKDWYWAIDKAPDLDWEPVRVSPGAPVLALHTGPSDDVEACLFTHLALLRAAKKRVWISNPYFVPPEGLSNALALAALQGLDVRIVVPNSSDSPLVNFASKVHIEMLLKAGVKFYRYKPGFLHQKVMLIDEQLGMVGSSNLDSRSLFINFEIMAITPDAVFLADLEKMFEADI